MNKKGEVSEDWDLLQENIAYIVLVVLFVLGIFLSVNNYRNGAAVWEDFYAKEIAKLVDLSAPGTEITLDVQTATEIAQKSGVRSFSDIFSFNNEKNEICVKLSASGSTCYSYFNNVKAYTVGEPVRIGIEKNVLYFRVDKKEKTG